MVTKGIVTVTVYLSLPSVMMRVVHMLHVMMLALLGLRDFRPSSGTNLVTLMWVTLGHYAFSQSPPQREQTLNQEPKPHLQRYPPVALPLRTFGMNPPLSTSFLADSAGIRYWPSLERNSRPFTCTARTAESGAQTRTMSDIYDPMMKWTVAGSVVPVAART